MSSLTVNLWKHEFCYIIIYKPQFPKQLFELLGSMAFTRHQNRYIILLLYNPQMIWLKIEFGPYCFMFLTYFMFSFQFYFDYKLWSYFLCLRLWVQKWRILITRRRCISHRIRKKPSILEKITSMGKNSLFSNFWSPIAKMMVKTSVSKTACVEVLGSSLPQWNLLCTVTKATLFWNRNYKLKLYL